MEVRDIRPGEETEAGRVTRLAYAEFADPGDPDWGGYLDQIGDVGGRSRRAPILVAVEEGGILGSATLESEGAGLGDDPIEPGTANIRMLGVDPAARGRAPAGPWSRRACAAPVRTGSARSRFTPRGR